MTGVRVGAVTIGQTPRPDLLQPLLVRAGDGIVVLEFGALDCVARGQLPRRDSAPAYPLTTRLRDGSQVTLEEADLAPHVQQAVDRAERAGADVTLLLCAGGFAAVTATRTLVRPFDAAVALLRAMRARRLVVIVPYAAQDEAARRKFEASGFDVTVVVGDPATIVLSTAEAAVDAVVLDYVGHPSSAVEGLRRRAPLPVVDLGEAGAEAAIAALTSARIPLPVARG